MTLSRPESRIQVLVVDDHPIVRRGLVDLLGEQDDMAVCGEAATVATALALVSATRPQVVIVDLWLGVESGLDLVTTLATAHPGVCPWCSRPTTNGSTPTAPWPPARPATS